MEIKDRIKKYLLKHKRLNVMVSVFRFRDDNYLSLISSAINNPNLVLYENIEQGSLPAICKIIAGGKSDGFFACMRWALDGLYFCERVGAIPILQFPTDSLYKNDCFEGNVFDYYFNPIKLKNDDNEANHVAIVYDGRNRLLAENMNLGVNYEVSNEYIITMSAIFHKYISFNEVTNNKLKDCVNEIDISNDTIGIHIRGTDYKGGYKGHPTYISPEEYFAHIDEAISKYAFDNIFLATDDEDCLNAFIKRYGITKVKYFKANSRSRGINGVHTAGSSNGYDLGFEVICDMYALSKCGGLLSGLSQVPLFSRIYKKSLNDNYKYDKIISLGVNHNGRKFRVK